MDTAVAAPFFVPPVPRPPETDLSFFRFLSAVRTNALQIWPREAYERDHLVQRFLGQSRRLLNAPEAIHHVLVDNSANYRRSRASIRILRPIMGAGLFLSEGDDWKLQRRTIAPALAPRMLPLLARHIAAVTAETVGDLRARSDRPVDLLEAMQFTTLEIAARSMFSIEIRQYGHAIRSHLTEFAERYNKPYLLDLLLPVSIPIPRDFARRRFQARWMALVEQMMAARSRDGSPDAPRDLLDLLLAARDPETGAAFSPTQLRDQVATMIVAGHETTALTLFWSLYLLASAPTEQDRVAREVAEIDLTPAAAGEALGRLPVTRAVVSEAMRLFPPAFALAREAIGDDEAGGVRIPGGSLVLIAPWVLHRQRRLWREPDAFEPSRFLPGAPPIPRFAYLPFGAGPRVCVGAQFAMAEATIVLASLIQAFHVALESRRPVLPAPVVTTRPDHAPAFRLSPREWERKLAALGRSLASGSGDAPPAALWRVLSAGPRSG